MTAYAMGLAAPEPPATTVLSIPGLRCAGCISKVETGLLRNPGVYRARVNLTAKRVTIAHAPSLREDALIAALDHIGFAAHDLAARGEPVSDTRTLMRATAVAGFAAMNVMLLSVSVWSGAGGATRDMFHWLSALIAMPTVAYSGRPFFRSAWNAVRRGRTNMDVPISVGVVIATALSLFETITHGEHAYFDGAVMLLFFLLTGRWLDAAMRDRARAGIDGLLRQMAPGGTVVVADGTTAWLRSDELLPGMTLLVTAGERIAADGEVVAGTSAIDRSLVTGESRPEPVGLGQAVLAGTLNLDAPLRVRVTAAGENTSLAQIARMTEAAEQGRSRHVLIADRAARLYAPVVHLLAAASFLGWLWQGAGWHQSLLIAVAVLIITCPCALGLAVPVAQVVASGALMRRGILVKSGSGLERLAEINAAVFDKTGTLTLGRPQCLEVALTDDERPIALAMAQASSHPLSKALTAALVGMGITPAQVDEIVETPGKGIEASFAGERVRLGSPAWCGATATGHESQVAFQMGRKPPSLMRFEDAIRPDATRAIAEMRSLTQSMTILSGDRAAAVALVGNRLRLPFQSGLTPQQKLAKLDAMQATGLKVLMVGDGLNDAPALAAGHASIAPATASDVGQTAADFVFLGDSLLAIPALVRAARSTLAVVRQNFTIAIGYNAFAVPLAVTGHVTPLVAALAMSCSSLLVVANALRLRRCAA